MKTITETIKPLEYEQDTHICEVCGKKSEHKHIIENCEKRHSCTHEIEYSTIGHKKDLYCYSEMTVKCGACDKVFGRIALLDSEESQDTMKVVYGTLKNYIESIMIGFT